MTKGGNVEQHYSSGDIEARIRTGLEALGKDIDNIEVDDLALVDAFHIRGRAATEELASWANVESGEALLDVGCGLGGTVRFFASTRGCKATGIDITPEYIDAAERMSTWVGLGDLTAFRTASALELPFADESFDIAWTEHVQMNIEDKSRFYGEIKRVLKPSGRLLFHDLFAGDGVDAFRYPVPWAYGPEISALAPFEDVRQLLLDIGFDVVRCEEKTDVSVEFFDSALKNFKVELPKLGINLLMGDNAIEKIENVRSNMVNDLVRVFMAVMQRRD